MARRNGKADSAGAAAVDDGFQFRVQRQIEEDGDGPGEKRVIASFAGPAGVARVSENRVRSVSAIAQLLAVNNLETKARVTQPYSESGWVHAVLKPIGQAVASVPLELWVGDPRHEKDAQMLAPADELSRLVANPNPAMTAAQFFEAGALHRKLDGEDFWLLLDGDGQPVLPDALGRIQTPGHVMSVRGRNVGLRTNALGWPEAWRFPMRGTSLTVPAGAVLQFRDYDPDNPLRGLGDVDAALADIDLEWQALRYQRAIIKHSGDPGGTVILEGAALQDDEREATEAEMNEEFSVQNAGRWRLLTGKSIKYEPNSLGPRDMDFQKMLAWIRDKVAAIVGVPLPIIGVLDHATLANFEKSVELFWKGGNGIVSYLSSVEDVVTNGLLRRLKRPDAPRLYARFDLSRVAALREDKNAQYDIAVRITQAGLGVSFEEALRLVGLDVEQGVLPMAGVRLVSSTLRPLEDVLEGGDEWLGEPDDPDDPPPEEPEDEPTEEPEEPEDDDGAKAAAVAVSASLPNAQAEDPAAERRAYWESCEAKLLVGGERKLRRAYKSWRRKYERAQIKRLRDFAEDGLSGVRFAPVVEKAEAPSLVSPSSLSGADVDVLLLQREEWLRKMIEGFTSPVRGIFLSSLADIAEELGVLPIDPTSPEVLRWIEEAVLKLSEGHTSVLAEKVRAALLEGLESAHTPGSLQEVLASVLPEVEGTLRDAFGDRARRADAIARTETARAVNGARYMELRHEGVERHEWITARDSAVRGTPGGPYEDAKYSHHELDGVAVHLGAEFDPSGHPGLKFPGDPDAAAGDTIQCRCVARGIVEKSGPGGPPED